jgi:hypothetical protein
MPNETPNSPYILIPEGCHFVFPAVADGDAALDFDQAPRCIHLAFQGRALEEFVRACIRLLRRTLAEPEESTPEQLERAYTAANTLLEEWEAAGLP